MTANELAYELERPNNWQQENNFTTRAATMLRQQQAEIYSLRKNLDVALMIINKPKLTDEEITELANEYLCYISHEYEVTGIYKFARAILRKANEK